MKKLFELGVCFLHPVAVVLMWIDLATRPDMGRGPKLAWAVFAIIPGAVHLRAHRRRPVVRTASGR